MKKTENCQTSNVEMVTISRAEYEKLQAQSKRVSELENRVDLLTEALRLARHKQFGASSEKSEETLMEQLSFLFDEAEVYSAAEKEENVTSVAAHKRHKKHEYTLDSIPEGMSTKQVEHHLEGKDLVCPQCGDNMTEIGKEVVRTLEIIPAQMVVREDICYTYACQTCNKEDTETPVVKSPKEKNIIPGSFATPEAVAHIMTQKFVMGSPLYRTSGDTDNPIVLYEYQPGRGAKHPKDFLAGYKGYLHADGYAGYHDLGEDIAVVGCWAHARRKFDEAVKSLPKGKTKGSSAAQGLAYCNLLFSIEQEIADKTAGERYEERLKQAKPVLDAMLS